MALNIEGNRAKFVVTCSRQLSVLPQGSDRNNSLNAITCWFLRRNNYSFLERKTDFWKTLSNAQLNTWSQISEMMPKAASLSLQEKNTRALKSSFPKGITCLLQCSWKTEVCTYFGRRHKVNLYLGHKLSWKLEVVNKVKTFTFQI